jgi:hypothetical protein
MNLLHVTVLVRMPHPGSHTSAREVHKRRTTQQTTRPYVLHCRPLTDGGYLVMTFPLATAGSGLPETSAILGSGACASQTTSVTRVTLAYHRDSQDCVSSPKLKFPRTISQRRPTMPSPVQYICVSRPCRQMRRAIVTFFRKRVTNAPDDDKHRCALEDADRDSCRQGGFVVEQHGERHKERLLWRLSPVLYGHAQATHRNSPDQTSTDSN